jgi:hypothetical protein
MALTRNTTSIAKQTTGDSATFVTGNNADPNRIVKWDSNGNAISSGYELSNDAFGGSLPASISKIPTQAAINILINTRLGTIDGAQLGEVKINPTNNPPTGGGGLSISPKSNGEQTITYTPPNVLTAEQIDNTGSDAGEFAQFNAEGNIITSNMKKSITIDSSSTDTTLPTTKATFDYGQNITANRLLGVDNTIGHGDFLSYNSATGGFETTTASISNHKLFSANHTDVATNVTPSYGDSIYYDGTEWTAGNFGNWGADMEYKGITSQTGATFSDLSYSGANSTTIRKFIFDSGFGDVMPGGSAGAASAGSNLSGNFSTRILTGVDKVEVSGFQAASNTSGPSGNASSPTYAGTYLYDSEQKLWYDPSTDTANRSYFYFHPTLNRWQWSNTIERVTSSAVNGFDQGAFMSPSATEAQGFWAIQGNSTFQWKNPTYSVANFIGLETVAQGGTASYIFTAGTTTSTETSSPLGFSTRNGDLDATSNSDAYTLSSKIQFPISGFIGAGLNNSRIRGVYIKAQVYMHATSSDRESEIYVTYPDGSRQILLRTDKESYFNSSANTNIEQTIFVPINEGQTQLQIEFNLDKSEKEGLAFEIIGALCTKRIELSPEVDHIQIVGSQDHLVSDTGYVDETTGSYSAADAIWSSVNPTIAPANNWSGVFPIVIPDNVSKTVIRTTNSWNQGNSSHEESDHITITIDWDEETIVGSSMFVEHITGVGFLYENDLVGEKTFTTESGAFETTIKFELNGRSIVKLPCPAHLGTYYNLSQNYTIENYKTIASTARSLAKGFTTLATDQLATVAAPISGTVDTDGYLIVTANFGDNINTSGREDFAIDIGGTVFENANRGVVRPMSDHETLTLPIAAGETYSVTANAGPVIDQQTLNARTTFDIRFKAKSTEIEASAAAAATVITRHSVTTPVNRAFPATNARKYLYAGLDLSGLSESTTHQGTVYDMSGNLSFSLDNSIDVGTEYQTIAGARVQLGISQVTNTGGNFRGVTILNAEGEIVSQSMIRYVLDANSALSYTNIGSVYIPMQAGVDTFTVWAEWAAGERSVLTNSSTSRVTCYAQVTHLYVS